MVFQNLGKIQMTRNKNRSFGRHFETVQHFRIFFAELYFFCLYIYGANFKVVFSGEGFHGTPLGHRRGSGVETPEAHGFSGFLRPQNASHRIIFLTFFRQVLLQNQSIYDKR